MDFKEFSVLVKGMKSVYTSPNFLPDADSVKIWYQLLRDIDYNVANVAIQKYIMTEKFPPTVADIREGAAAVLHGERTLWSDGWEEVRTAIRKFGMYRPQEAMASMSEITRQAVERLGFQNLCLSENAAVDRANFRMIYEQIESRQHELQQIPTKLTNLIAEAQQRLIAGKEE